MKSKVPLDREHGFSCRLSNSFDRRSLSTYELGSAVAIDEFRYKWVKVSWIYLE